MLAEKILDYLTISINGGADYHPFENKIAYVSDSSGVYQIYVRDLETDVIGMISTGEDRSTNPVYLPNGDLVYSTDFGGNENFQIIVYREATGEHFRLTSFLEAKHRFQFATDNAIYISANLLDNQRFDVFRYPFPLQEDQQEELLLEGEPFIPLVPSIVNHEENLLIVNRIKSNLANDLILLDLSHKTQHNITENFFEGHNARFQAVEFLSDTKLLVRSDLNRDFMSLAIFHINSGEIHFLEKDDWDTGRTLVILKDEIVTQLVLSKNIDGSSCLFLCDFDGESLLNKQPLNLPSAFGILSSGDYRTYTRSFVLNADQNKILLTFSSPTAITNIYELDLSSNSISPVAASPIFDGDPFVGYSLHRFSSFDGLQVPYFVMRPEGSGPFPTIFLIHGGPEGQSTAGFSNVLQLFASEGYQIIVPNIRGSNGYGRRYLALDDIEKRLDSIRDIKALVDYLTTNDDSVDPNKLIIYGGSYGGFAVLSSITEYPDLFHVAVDIVGISNFVTFLENTADWRRRLREVEYGFLDLHRDFLESISPSNKVHLIQTPTLIIQGDNDERVPLSESLQMYEKLQSRGVAVELLRFDDEGHGVVKRKNKITQYQAVFDFLNKCL